VQQNSITYHRIFPLAILGIISNAYIESLHVDFGFLTWLGSQIADIDEGRAGAVSL